MNSINKIAVFTSIRSEYGVMVPVLRKLNSVEQFDVKLLVGGSHLLEEHGYTIKEIENDGFQIAEKFPFLFTDNLKSVNTRSIAVLQMQMGDYLVQNTPDLLLICGDRFELLPVVTSALLLNIPIAHISGGDVTEGAIDNQIRHAISKIANIHFPSTEKSKQNLLKMGEEEWRICVTGEPGIDCILLIEPTDKEKLFNEIGLSVEKKIIISTFHPETISNRINSSYILNLFQHLIRNYPEFEFLVTSSNFDNGGNEINETFTYLAEIHPSLIFIKNLGQKRYYSVLKYAACMLGNSSSGIIESQSFNLPVVNVGSRQQGRDQNPNVINSSLDIQDIIIAINKSISKEFKDLIINIDNLYGNGNCSGKISEYLKNIDKRNLLLKKSIF